MKMKTRFLVSLVAIALLLTCIATGCAEGQNEELHFDRYYISLPEMNIRADPDTPGAIDVLHGGDEVELISTSEDGIWSTFKYTKDGEERTGCTWTGAVAKAIRIHLLEDEFCFHKPGCTRSDLGMVSTRREPTDPDLLILFEETADDGSEWLYITSTDGARCGYMRRDAKFEIVE